MPPNGVIVLPNSRQLAKVNIRVNLSTINSEHWLQLLAEIYYKPEQLTDSYKTQRLR